MTEIQMKSVAERDSQTLDANMYGISTKFPIGSIILAARIDWIKLRVRLSRPTQFSKIQERLVRANGGSIPWVEPDPDGGPKNSCTVFIVTIQNPQGPSEVKRYLQSMPPLGAKPLDDADIEISSIEVSLDVRPKDRLADHQWINEMLEHLIAYCRHRPNEGPRLRSAAPKHSHLSSGVIFKRRDLVAALNAGISLHSGCKESDFRQRWYAKTYDTVGEEKYKPLPQEQWCARYEVTFEKHPPFTTLEQWRNFRFASLRTEYFDWRREPMIRQGDQLRAFGLLPQTARIRGEIRHRRFTYSGTRADVAFGEAVKNALKRLDRRQRGLYSRKAQSQKSEQHLLA